MLTQCPNLTSYRFKFSQYQRYTDFGIKLDEIRSRFDVSPSLP